jgi:hypothetical protein
MLLVVKRLLYVVQEDGEEQNFGVRLGIGRHDDVRVTRHPQQVVHPMCYRLFRFLDQVTNAFSIGRSIVSSIERASCCPDRLR